MSDRFRGRPSDDDRYDDNPARPHSHPPASTPDEPVKPRVAIPDPEELIPNLPEKRAGLRGVAEARERLANARRPAPLPLPPLPPLPKSPRPTLDDWAPDPDPPEESAE